MTAKERTRKKIMDIALTLFSEQGYSVTTTKQIAESAGVNEITLFRHFGTKEKLFQETTQNYVQHINLRKEIDEFKDESFDDCVRDISRDYLKYCFDNIMIYKIQMRMSEDDQEFVKLKLSREFKMVLEELFTYLISEGKIKGNPEIMAATLVSGILGTFTVYVLTNNTFTNINIQELVDEQARQFAKYYSI